MGVRRFSLAEGGERGSICTKISRFIHAGGRKTSQETLTDAQKSVFPDRESGSSFPGHHVGTALYESGKKCAHRDALPSREEVGKRRDGETAAAQRRRCDGSTAAARYQHGSGTTAARQRRDISTAAARSRQNPNGGRKQIHPSMPFGIAPLRSAHQEAMRSAQTASPSVFDARKRTPMPFRASSTAG